MQDDSRYGALYVAFGAPYLAMALYSASTLRKTNPAMPFCIATNIDLDPKTFSFWDPAKDSLLLLPMSDEENRRVKTAAVDYSPFEKTVFLDCDTFVNGDLRDGSLLLEYFDVGFRGETDPPKCDVPVIRGHPVARFNHWNSGVFLFRKSAECRDFFGKWRAGYDRFGVEFDQVSLVEALFTTSARMISLESRWNDMSFYSISDARKNSRAKVIHYTSRISFAIERKLRSMCGLIASVPDAHDQLRTFVGKKRNHRRKKIGFWNYSKLRIKWLIHP